MSDNQKTYTIEEVNAYRAEVHRTLLSWGETEADANYACDYHTDMMAGDITTKPFKATEQDIISRWSYIMWQSPEDYANLMCM